LPNSGAHTDSTRPDAAGFGGAASMTGWAATGEATTTGTDATTGAGTDAAAELRRSPLAFSAPTEAGTSTTGTDSA
jgi:hypothetical protein